MKKRLLATALLLCMIFTLFPMSAFAEADVEEAVPEEITLDEASDQASSVEDPVPGDAVIEETLEDGDFVDDLDVEGIIAEETSSEDAFTEETAEDAVIAEPATDDTEEMLMESSSTPTVLMSADQVEDTTISSVSVTISEPVKGFSPDLSPSVPEGAHYSVIGVKWFEENMDPISSPETYAFQYPGKVIVTLVLKADSGYEFAHNATPAAVNGSYDTYDYNYASGDSFLMFS